MIELHDAEIATLKAKRVCYQCITEDYLSGEIRSSGEKRKCAYCQSTRKTVKLEEVAGRVNTAVDQHYFITSPNPNSLERMMASDPESDYDFERHGEPVVFTIAELLLTEIEIAHEIQLILSAKYADFEAAQMGEETPFECGTYYQRKSADSWEWDQSWDQFVQSLKAEARLFNSVAASTLEAIFNDLEKIQTNDDHHILVTAGPGTEITHLYRARVFLKSKELAYAIKRPDQSLGPPPSEKASAGRMNPYGISVFYGATDWTVALAEVRPPVGSRTVTARFEIMRPLTLLNLSAFDTADPHGSMLDPTYLGLREKAAFLNRMTEKLTAPVMPGDELADYLPTQAVSEFLASRTNPAIDGIMFPSVQSAEKGVNVVLFRKSCMVEEMDLPAHTHIESHAESAWNDNDYYDYTVWEHVPVPMPGSAPDDLTEPYNLLQYIERDEGDYDTREPTLRIDLTEIAVHLIEGVSIKSSPKSVTRRRMEVYPGASWPGLNSD